MWIALFGNLDGRALAEARFGRSSRLHGRWRALTGNGEFARSQKASDVKLRVGGVRAAGKMVV